MVATVKSRSVDRRLDALGQLDLADVDRIADFQPVEVDVELARDVGRVADQLDFVLDDVENAAALEARRGVFIVEAHRDRTVTLVCSPMRRKSTWIGRLETGWKSTALGSVRCGLPPTSTITTEFMKWPGVEASSISSFSSTWIESGSFFSP